MNPHSLAARADGAGLLLRRATVSIGLSTLALAACGGGGDDAARPTVSDPAPMASDATLTQRIASLHAGLEQELGHGVPSVSVLIQTPTGTYFTAAVAAGSDTPTPDSHFRFASNTKTFAAAAVMKMHQDGWLNYGDRVNAFIPGSKATYLPNSPAWGLPNKNSMTIRQLLQHSAGVFDVANDPVPESTCTQTYEECVLATDPTHTFTVEELVSQNATHGLSYFLPGQGYHYSDTGYSMLAEIVAQVYSQRTGQARTWADYVRDQLTGPKALVPLSQLSFPDVGTDTVLPSPRICGHIAQPDGTVPEICDINISAKVAEGNGIGTMRQLNQWVRSVQSGHNVLSPATVALLREDTSAANPTYGLGTIHVENLGFGHNGATNGNLSLMLYDPVADVSVVVLIPYWDLTDGKTSFLKVFEALNCAGWRAREAFGYPGQPSTSTCPDT